MKPVVTRVTQFNQIDRLGNPVPAYNVQFTVGTHGPFTVTLLGSEFSAAAAQAKMQAVADTINALPTGA